VTNGRRLASIQAARATTASYASWKASAECSAIQATNSEVLSSREEPAAATAVRPG
jgi:hypothetical protein